VGGACSIHAEVRKAHKILFAKPGKVRQRRIFGINGKAALKHGKEMGNEEMDGSI
jgi:hypothetical protein